MSLNRKIVSLVIGTAFAMAIVSMATIYILNMKIKVAFDEKLRNEKLTSLIQVIESIANEVSISFSNAISKK